MSPGSTATARRSAGWRREWSADEQLISQFRDYRDVDGLWLHRPEFGDWATLVDPATGPQRNAAGYLP